LPAFTVAFPFEFPFLFERVFLANQAKSIATRHVENDAFKFVK